MLSMQIMQAQPEPVHDIMMGMIVGSGHAHLLLTI